jgi:predicted protein tyrosine phosphatase
MDATRREPLLPFEITICGLDELPSHSDSGVTHALSILDPGTPEPRALSDYADLRARWLLRFDDIARRLPATQAPEADDVVSLLGIGREMRTAPAPAHMLIHCHAGVSRSTAAAMILLAQRHPGRERDAAALVRRLRPVARPNRRMLSLADEILGRGGAFTAAGDLF